MATKVARERKLKKEKYSDIDLHLHYPAVLTIIKSHCLYLPAFIEQISTQLKKVTLQIDGRENFAKR